MKIAKLDIYFILFLFAAEVVEKQLRLLVVQTVSSPGSVSDSLKAIKDLSELIYEFFYVVVKVYRPGY